MTCLSSALNDALKMLRRCTRGNISLLLSLSLLALAGCMGAAIDYVRLTREETLFAAAADAAVLAAVSSANTVDVSGSGDPVKAALLSGKYAWNANIARSAVNNGRDPDINVYRDSGGWHAAVSYDALAPTSFMSLLGVRTMRIAGTAHASGGTQSINYWDFHLAVDTSSSMGLAATPTDMNAMYTKFECEFACHTSQFVRTKAQAFPYFGIVQIYTATPKMAHDAGIKLRIDVVDQALDAMVAQMKSWSDGTAIRAKLWGLNNSVDSLVDLTSKLDDVKDYVLGMQQETISIGNTNYVAAMAKLESEIGASGSGTSPAAPRKALFLITDGMHDSRVWTSNTITSPNTDHYFGAMDPAFCSSLKQKGVLIGVLYIDYYAPPNHTEISAAMPALLPGLKGCASDNMFFNATTPADMTSALSNMFKRAMATTANGTVRLVN